MEKILKTTIYRHWLL